MISVITASIPGRSELLARACRSVEAQTRPPDEHLVRVDHERAGAARTRNVLLEAAEGELVAVLDDDDELLPRHLELLVRRSIETGADVVYSDPDPRGKVPSGVGRDFDSAALRARNFVPATVVLRRDVALDVGGFPDVHAEDWGLWLLLDQAGARFEHVAAPTWIYHRSNDGKQATRPPGARAQALALVR